MFIHQISVFVENRTGSLAKITGVLAHNNIDIRAFSIADTTDFGILRLIVDQPELAVQALKEAGAAATKTEVIAVRLKDKPGALHKILAVLSDEGMSVEYVYAFLTGKDADAYMVLRVEDNVRAVEILKREDHTLLTGEEIYTM